MATAVKTRESSAGTTRKRDFFSGYSGRLCVNTSSLKEEISGYERCEERLQGSI